MEVYITYGRTESGDDWSLAFMDPPSEENIIGAINNDLWLREEYEAECIMGWNTVRLNVIDNRSA